MTSFIRLDAFDVTPRQQTAPESGNPDAADLEPAEMQWPDEPLRQTQVNPFAFHTPTVPIDKEAQRMIVLQGFVNLCRMDLSGDDDEDEEAIDMERAS